MDVKTMYPNFCAEQRNHHVQENSTMAVPTKRRQGSGRRDRCETTTRPPSRTGLAQLKQRLHRNQTEATGRSKSATPLVLPRQGSNQHDSGNSDMAPESIPSSRPPSRQVALRGELSLTSPAWGDNSDANAVRISPRLQPLRFSSSAGSARPLPQTSATTESESLQDLVMNARPRTRYARRELHRQGSAKTLARISTAPTPLRQSLDGSSLISSRSSGSLFSADTKRPPSRQAVQIAVVNTVEAVLPGLEADGDSDDDDDTNFFLTELEAAARAASAAAAAKLQVLARHVTLGSFLLYGNPPALVAAIQHFTEALKSIERSHKHAISSANLALTSLVHHHRGVALRELVVASASRTSNAATTCIKQAFAAQRRALELAQRAKDLRLQARAVKALGLLLLDAHAYGPALTHQQEALQIALEERDRELEARVYANLGNLALAQLNFGHALSCHHRDLHLCSSKGLDCRLGRARAHRNLSIVYARLHRRDQQLNHEKEARIAAYSDGGAYLYDVATNPGKSVGNICLQPSTDIDPALVALVSQNLTEIVRGVTAHRSREVSLENTNEDSIIAALEQEWSSAEVDLEAAVTAVSTEPKRQARTKITQKLPPSRLKAPTRTSLSRHVSIRIDNYSSTFQPQPKTSVQSQEP